MDREKRSGCLASPIPVFKSV
ncbi:hypothetical protein BDFB_015139 [Asbolus verrucosus]|uniref:Uncharacterized protein n=1 Tax=Asbolus verrucosus TaxID=1661398 RepID=A0A482VPD5_ASBVE|nr:hypothetical protein BDFB_015139 [Asbolus verrucosus]